MMNSKESTKCSLTIFKPCGLDLLIDTVFMLGKNKPISFMNHVKKCIAEDHLRITLDERDKVVMLYCPWENDAVAQMKY